MTYPYDDQDMTYDKALHMYVLSEGCVRDNLGVELDTYLDSSGDINQSTIGKRVLRRISMHLYHYIYAHSSNKMYIEFLLAKYPPCRELIKECLLNEVYYNLRNGDFYNSVDSSVAWEKSVSPDTRSILAEPLPMGVKLLYGGYTMPRGRIVYREDY